MLADFLRRLRQYAVHPLMLSFYIPALMVSIGTGLLSPVLPLFVKELGGSYGWVGLVLSGLVNTYLFILV